MPDVLRRRARTHPDHPAVVTGDGATTYGALDAQADAIASALVDAGARAGDRVALLAANGAPFVAAVHAAARAGVTLVPLNTRLTTRELAWQAAKARVRVVLADASTAAPADALVEGGRVVIRLDARVDAPARRVPAARAAPWDAPAAVVFTSGTTGNPKGAVLTHRNFLAGAAASAARLGVKRNDRWLLPLPLFHVGGLAAIARAVVHGITLVLTRPGRFDARAVNAMIDAGDVTLASLVPTMLHRVLDDRGGHAFPPTLRAILLGGAAAPATLLARAADAGAVVCATYGLTEACSQVATVAPADAPAPPGCVGHPIPGTRVRIRGEGGADAMSGEVGEILVRGPTVMAGYDDAPDATARALADGWLATGDLGRVDEAGRLWMASRRSDLIVTGGENVYPAEVEGVLLDHPAVAAACVVGVPDDEWGHVVAAAVVPRQDAGVDAKGLAAFARARLAGYKVPRQWAVVDALPLTASGKVARREVAARLAKDHATSPT